MGREKRQSQSHLQAEENVKGLLQGWGLYVWTKIYTINSWSPRHVRRHSQVPQAVVILFQTPCAFRHPHQSFRKSIHSVEHWQKTSHLWEQSQISSRKETGCRFGGSCETCHVQVPCTGNSEWGWVCPDTQKKVTSSANTRELHSLT